MLNSTLCAATRVICAILENYQTPEGVNVPDVLQPYLGGTKFFPFVHQSMPIGKGAKGKVKKENKQKSEKQEDKK